MVGCAIAGFILSLEADCTIVGCAIAGFILSLELVRREFIIRVGDVRVEREDSFGMSVR